MKKYNEGYTLPFVLVVFLVTSLVAVSILTVSIHNLHGQKASVHRMEAQYAAQGEIERVVAQLVNYPKSNTLSETQLRGICGETVETEDWQYSVIGTTETISFTLKATSGTIEVSCKVILTGVEQEVLGDNTLRYKMTDPKVTFETYTISTIEPTTEESAGGPQ